MTPYNEQNNKKNVKCEAPFVNPLSSDGYIYIRDINRSGRRSRERTIWPQTNLAYLTPVAYQEIETTNAKLGCVYKSRQT